MLWLDVGHVATRSQSSNNRPSSAGKEELQKVLRDSDWARLRQVLGKGGSLARRSRLLALAAHISYFFSHADLRQDPHGQDYHSRC